MNAYRSLFQLYRAFRHVRLLSTAAGQIIPQTPPQQQPPPTSLTSSFAMANGANLHYYRSGKGKRALLFLHGGVGAGLLHFESQLQSPALQEKFDMIAVDLRGFGKSRPPERKPSANFYHQDADDVASLMDSLKINRYSVAGWCLGGSVALILAAMRAQCVEKLMVWGALPYVDQAFIDKTAAIEHVSTWKPATLRRLAKFYPIEVSQHLWSTWIRGARVILRERKGDICVNDLPEIKCPTFVLHGSDDTLIPGHNAEFIRRNICSPVRYAEFRGPHNFHFTSSDRFNATIAEFMH
ncbi:valacyclovir hydrolase-like [Oscarella lobularis]|uniref:valacyclovir hydrolase-like n=1 Tax=Oscarella lobularis TaxID=121494 RepID=UPI003313AB50